MDTERIIQVTRYDGGYTSMSGFTANEEDAATLLALGLAHHEIGWGIEVYPEVVAKLTTEFTLTQAQELSEIVRKNAERAAARRAAALTGVRMSRCDCGHTVPTRTVMDTSTGSSCPECYDRMSQ